MNATPHPAHPLRNAQPAVSSAPPVTRVALVYAIKRVNLYLRFGHPARELILDDSRRCAVFLPGTCFARVHWEANDYGTTHWQLLVLRAYTPPVVAQRIPGIWPGAHILLRAEGERQVRDVLRQIDAIEALAIDPVDVSPSYWRTLGNRLAAYLPLMVYTAERHAAWLARRGLR